MEMLLRHSITALVREYQWDEKWPAPCVLRVCVLASFPLSEQDPSHDSQREKKEHESCEPRKLETDT